MKELTLKQAAEDCRGTLTPEQAEGMIPASRSIRAE